MSPQTDKLTKNQSCVFYCWLNVKNPYIAYGSLAQGSILFKMKQQEMLLECTSKIDQ